MSMVRSYTYRQGRGKLVRVPTHVRRNNGGSLAMKHKASRNRLPSNITPSDTKRMKEALKLIGFSGHTRSPRFGPKAQVARWGLGKDQFPVEYSVS